MAPTPDFPMEEMMAGRIRPLRKVDDDFGGVIVELTEPMEYEVFASSLRYSLAQWRRLGKKGVWIKVPIHLVYLAQAAVKEGFWFHHAEPNYLMLIYNIPGGPNTLPTNASHRVSIGAFVMNDKREVLVVQEKNGPFRGWKIPTGVVEEGEDIYKAVVREVKEETAIDTEFVEVLAFRQTHKALFSKSNLMFVCMLRPLSSKIKVQELELQAAKWMSWEEYVSKPYVRNCEYMKQLCEVFLTKKYDKYSGFTPVSTAEDPSQPQNYLYLNTQDMEMQSSLEQSEVEAQIL